MFGLGLLVGSESYHRERLYVEPAGFRHRIVLTHAPMPDTGASRDDLVFVNHAVSDTVEQFAIPLQSCRLLLIHRRLIAT